MYMRLDVFADLLRVRSGVLLHAVRTTGELDGMRLPVRRQVRGAAIMFNQVEAMEFAARWHGREQDNHSVPSGAPLITLGAFAKQADIAPLALWQVICSSKRLRGITLPVPVRSEGQLLFEPAAVSQFVRALRGVSNGGKNDTN